LRRYGWSAKLAISILTDFEQFAEGTKGKKGTAQVDDAFLEEIERWRDLLARQIAAADKQYTEIVK